MLKTGEPDWLGFDRCSALSPFGPFFRASRPGLLIVVACPKPLRQALGWRGGGNMQYAGGSFKTFFTERRQCSVSGCSTTVVRTTGSIRTGHSSRGFSSAGHTSQSITPVACNNNDCGIVMPIALAIFIFMTISYRLDCSIGISAGLAPRRIRSTALHAMRLASWRSGP